MSWKKVKLGEACNIEKGAIGILKAVPGEFPLVVTGEDRKSHNEYQFDDEAVIIPLVSGTGHGHASIKRIHFQSGKFALGNILCAVIPKDKNQLNAEYLYRFLDLNKEDELVARMKGMANVTLPIKEIAQIEIPIPSLKEQIEFVENYKTLESHSNSTSTELTHQLTLVKKLRQQLLQDAVQGKLVEQNKNDEPASELLKKIKAEKTLRQAQGDKKVKKEKELPPIKPEEIPFEIPENWSWCRLGEIANLVTSGSRDWAKYYSTEGDIFVRMGNLSRDSYNLRMDKIQYIKPPKNQEGNRTRLEEDDILISITGEVGNLGLIPKDFGEAYINQHTALVRLNKAISIKYICNLFLSKTLQEQFNAPQRGMKNSFRLSDIDYLLIPLPPLAEQNRIVQKLDELMQYCNELEASIKQSKTENQMLLQQVLREALQPTKEIEKIEEEVKWQQALLIKQIEKILGINYGEVAIQKTIFHIGIIEAVFNADYSFYNSNYGTYSTGLRDDLKSNPYLIKKKVKGRDVFDVSTDYIEDIEKDLAKPKNRNFVDTINQVLNLYKSPFINKETDKIELFNTVCKIIIDTQSIEINFIRRKMKDWRTPKTQYQNKAEKFSLSETKKCINFIREEGWLANLIR